jgi:hypothetical protein
LIENLAGRLRWLFSKEERQRRYEDKLAAEARGKAYDLKSHKAGVRDQKSSEDFPSGSSGVGLIP